MKRTTTPTRRRFRLVSAALGLLLVGPIEAQGRWLEGILEWSLPGAVRQRLEDLSTDDTGQKRKVYVSCLPLIDGISKTNFLSPAGEVLDQTVRDGVKNLADLDPWIVFDDPAHRVAQEEDSSLRLLEIWFDPGLTRDEKYARIENEILDPQGVDILVAGFIIDSGEAFQYRPIVASRLGRTLRTRELQYANRDAVFEEVDGTLTLSAVGQHELWSLAVSFLEGL